jgi:hypothetical protein
MSLRKRTSAGELEIFQKVPEARWWPTLYYSIVSSARANSVAFPVQSNPLTSLQTRMPWLACHNTAESFGLRCPCYGRPRTHRSRYAEPSLRKNVEDYKVSISLREPFRSIPACFSAMLNWPFNEIILVPLGIANRKLLGSSPVRFVNILSNRRAAADLKITSRSPILPLTMNRNYLSR